MRLKPLLCYILLMMSMLNALAAVEETLTSPDGRLTFLFRQDVGLYYSVLRDGKEIVGNSRLGVAVENKLFESALGVPNEDVSLWGEGWCNNLQLKDVERCSVDTVWSPLYGEWSVIPDHYNEMTIHFMKGIEERGKDGGYVKSRCYYLNLRVRVYNEGVAFCYDFPETSNGLFLHLTDELTEFRVPTGAKALCTAWAQGVYEWRSLSEPWSDLAERPLTICMLDGTAISILEARLVDYSRTKFLLKGENCIKAQPYSSTDVMTPFATSWRLIMIGDSMVDLCNHDYMVLNLSDKPDERNDWSWIKPGKVFRTDLNKKAIFDAVDFAAARHFQYVHLDAGWYGPEMQMASSALSVADNRDFTIPEIVEYAKKKGIGVFLYVNQRALYQQLDDILPLFEEWGVKGIKFGFVQVGNQQWTTWLHDAVRKCAEHHLMVDIHDEYRPTGVQRTYPNLMTAEGIRGNEEMPDATHNVTLPFTRFLCGPADYTLCYYNGRVKNTKAHQLAMAVVYYSPLTWMFWYDKPAMFKDEPEIEFWEKVPTVWDDTKVLQGNPGEYIVTARRLGEDWYLGAMTNTDSRVVTLSLDFLKKGKKYMAHLYEDDSTITDNLNNKNVRAAKRTKVRCTVKKITSRSTLTLPMQKSGGAAIWFEEI